MMETINILYLVNDFEFSGANAQLLALVEKLNRDRFRPQVVALRGSGELEAVFDEAGVDPMCVDTKGALSSIGFRAVGWLRKFIKDERINIVQTFGLQSHI